MKTTELPRKDNQDMDFLLNRTLGLFFTEKRHEELVRCQDCGIKYEIWNLKRVTEGRFLCVYCIKSTNYGNNY